MRAYLAPVTMAGQTSDGRCCSSYDRGDYNCLHI